MTIFIYTMAAIGTVTMVAVIVGYSLMFFDRQYPSNGTKD